MDKRLWSKHVSEQANFKGIPGIPWRLYVLVLGIGLLIVAPMLYGFHLGNYMVEKYTPLIDAAMEIKLEAAFAHLWFEEIIAGDSVQDPENVTQHLDQAQWYATAMLEGGINSEGKFIPLEKRELRDEIGKVLEKITEFRKIIEQHFATMHQTGGNSPIDQRYDAIFWGFIEQADKVESNLQGEILAKAKIYKNIQAILVCVSLMLIGIIVSAFYFFERRRSADMELLNTVNANLQQALQEVKTLKGIIPICSYCKKIRDNKGEWNHLETYINSHSEAELSHGLCPDCYNKEIESLEKIK
ncbi:MAG: hypothetical protein ACWGOX_13710 [Desulforhopalus sp.]